MQPAPDAPPPVLDEATTVEAFVDAFIDGCYRHMADPTVLHMLRLMIAESTRVPELIQRWHHSFVVSFHRTQADTLARAVERGLVRASPLTDQFSLAYAPVLYAAITQLVTGQPSLADPALRDAHARMMLSLLRAP